MNIDTLTWVEAFYTPLVKNQAAAKIVAKTNDGEESENQINSNNRLFIFANGILLFDLSF
jgi:hypothetical protein